MATSHLPDLARIELALVEEIMNAEEQAKKLLAQTRQQCQDLLAAAPMEIQEARGKLLSQARDKAAKQAQGILGEARKDADALAACFQARIPIVVQELFDLVVPEGQVIATRQNQITDKHG